MVQLNTPRRFLGIIPPKKAYIKLSKKDQVPSNLFGGWLDEFL